MPVYEYECEHCGARFERVQSVRDEPIRTCPECSGTVHKVFHPAGIIFRGSGWYITDSRKSSTATVTGENKSNGESKEEKKTDVKTDAKSEGKSEDKSETKSETKSQSREKK